MIWLFRMDKCHRGRKSHKNIRNAREVEKKNSQNGHSPFDLGDFAKLKHLYSGIRKYSRLKKGIMHLDLMNKRNLGSIMMDLSLSQEETMNQRTEQFSE